MNLDAGPLFGVVQVIGSGVSDDELQIGFTLIGFFVFGRSEMEWAKYDFIEAVAVGIVR